MPQSAVDTGLVDLVLPLRSIPQAIGQFVATQPRVPLPADGEPVADDARQLLQNVFSQIHARERPGRLVLELLQLQRQRLSTLVRSSSRRRSCGRWSRR